MKTYTAKIDGGETQIEADTIADALREAKEWASAGDWDMDEGTIWVDVSVESEEQDEDGDPAESRSFTLAIDPDEPDCEGEEHDWQSPHEIVGGIKENPGVWGHGGGVIISECCIRCGCKRMTDTWAQRPDTGEQGLRSVSYQPDHYSIPH